jgi:hypothetical protein
MSWTDTLVPMLRNLVGDTDSTSYTDCRLEQILAVAAQLVIGEVSFDIDYTIDIDAVTIIPDPISNSDDMFINLVSLKASCILMRSEMKTAASKEGILIKDGMGSLEVRGGFKAHLDMAKSFCDAYEKAKMEMLRGNFAGVKAIFNVASGPNINTYFNRGRGASFY